MVQQTRHALLSRPTTDEAGREAFLASMRQFLIADLYSGNEVAYRKRQVPAFAARHGRPPKTYLEVKSVMDDDKFFRAFSLLNRATQELLWDTVGVSIERLLPALHEAAAAVPPAGGTLTLNPEMVLPDYYTKVDVHVMPGSFHKQVAPDDVYGGAVYDRGVYVYAYGGLGPQNDGLGLATLGCVKRRFPNLKPLKILDMGCGAGMSTLPFAAAYPEAEITAVDLAAPMLRYGHGRAESLGVPVHFVQASASDTGLPAGSFDLVVSTIMLHEMPQKYSKQVVAECHRLLKPGGVMVHNDLVGWPEDPFQEFMAEWNVHHNNEVFERGSGTLDWRAACVDAGFPSESVFWEPVEASYMSEQLAYVGFRGAVKAI
jgi:2-polyprenyl-3-methyl-5-hydroxy-6-metoxy-1,4-benzoquinol methylase